MKRFMWIRIVFVLAAIYDGVLGLAFAIAPWRVFEMFQVTPPNHWGYVQFPAALLLVFAAMFIAVACDPVRCRNFVPCGIGLKVAYCAVAFAYWLGADIPAMWKPFAVIDLVTIILFAWAYFALAPARAEGAADN